MLGIQGRGEGCLQGGALTITWCIGHLVTLAEPHEIDAGWRRWAASALPMLPSVLPLRPLPGTRGQWEAVRKLLVRHDVDDVVNACDAGREGELIFRQVYALAGCRAPVLRLWVSSMTDQAIHQAWARLRPSADYDALAQAARCRAESDWLVGLNATRALTIRGRASGVDTPLYSVGRVQTPTLALLVDREAAIRVFVPQAYWLLDALFEAPGGRYRGRWSGSPPAARGRDEVVGRLPDEASAEAIRQRILGRTGHVVSVERVVERLPPPLLFTLTSLQQVANRRYGLSAAQTLEIAQALYERHKLITYPRTDAPVLSSDQVPGLGNRVRAVAVPPWGPFCARILDGDPSPKLGRRFVDDAAVTDHHAIVPTEARPSPEALTSDERRVHDLIVRRFLGAFFPDAQVARTRIRTEVEGEPFLTRGSEVLDPGWREVAGFDDADAPPRRRGAAGAGTPPAPQEGEGEEDSDEQPSLPALTVGDPSKAVEARVSRRETRPPPRYTEARLLQAMEGAGRALDDEELRRALRDRGLGTPATRAAVIETLIRRGYVARERKLLVPTPQGEELVTALPVAELKSAELTGDWEARLARIARRETDPDAFMEEVRKFTAATVLAILQAVPPRTVAGDPENVPRRSPGPNHPSPARATPGRRHSSPDPAGGSKVRSPRTLPTGAARTSAAAPRTRARTPGGDPGAGGAPLGPRRTTTRPGSPPHEPAPPLQSDPATPPCPLCRQGRILKGRRGWGCTRWRDGCGFVLWQEQAGRSLGESEVFRLVATGSVGPLEGFRRSDGTPFSATLELRCSAEEKRAEVVFRPVRGPG